MSPKRILVVEDEEDGLKLVTDILEKMLKQTVLAATDGLQAIQMAHDHRPDIILMDLSLPKLDGWAATRSLRSSEIFRHTPIIALTAHAMVGAREQALEAGCTDYFSKPIDIDAFVAFLEPYLND